MFPTILKKPLMLSCLVALSWVSVGCQQSKPKFVYMPDMVYSPAFKAQKEGAMRMPVPGTVSRDFSPYQFAHLKSFQDTPNVGKMLPNPIRPTKDVLARGQQMYNVYCVVCHGPQGEGDGTIVPKFPRPPSLQSDKIRNYLDGSIFHVMTVGQNLMPSYAAQVLPEDRWAIVHYIRALHRAKKPTADDLSVAGK